MKYAVIYCLRIWLTLTLLSPLLVSALRWYNAITNNVLLSGVDKSLIYHRIFLKIPSMLWSGAIMYLVVVCGIFITLYLLREKQFSINKLKLCACIVAVLLIALPFVIVYFELGDSAGQRIVAYIYIRALLIDSCVAIASVWFYKLKRPLMATVIT